MEYIGVQARGAFMRNKIKNEGKGREGENKRK